MEKMLIHIWKDLYNIYYHIAYIYVLFTTDIAYCYTVQEY